MFHFQTKGACREKSLWITHAHIQNWTFEIVRVEDRHKLVENKVFIPCVAPCFYLFMCPSYLLVSSIDVHACLLLETDEFYFKISREKHWLQPLEWQSHIWMIIWIVIQLHTHSSKSWWFHLVFIKYRDFYSYFIHTTYGNCIIYI